MITKSTPSLVMQYMLSQWLNEYINNYALVINFEQMNFVQNNPVDSNAEDIFNGHSTISITADGAPLVSVPDIGQRGTINAYTMISGDIMNIIGECDIFKLWLNGDDITPIAPGDVWDGTFEETIPGIYILEGRKNFASGYIIIEVT